MINLKKIAAGAVIAGTLGFTTFGFGTGMANATPASPAIPWQQDDGWGWGGDDCDCWGWGGGPGWGWGHDWGWGGWPRLGGWGHGWGWGHGGD